MWILWKQKLRNTVLFKFCPVNFHFVHYLYADEGGMNMEDAGLPADLLNISSSELSFPPDDQLDFLSHVSWSQPKSAD